MIKSRSLLSKSLIPPEIEASIHISVKVHWGEQDAFGHLNNVHYLRYFESARIAYIATSGWMEKESSIKPILAETQIKYRAQVVFPATLDLYTCTLELREKGATCGTLFMNGNIIVAGLDQVLPLSSLFFIFFKEARAVVLSFDYQKQKTVPIPHQVIDHFKRIDSFQDPAIRKRLLDSFQ